MRRVGSPPSFAIVAPPRKVIWEGEIQVVTPMFGGSATAGKVDPERPVNAKMIRGHLRFWWRALHAHRFLAANSGTPTQSLFCEESRLWGGVTKPDPRHSVVDVVVSAVQSGKPFRCRNTSAPGYALFPFRQARPSQEGLEGVSFKLALAWSQSEQTAWNDELRARVRKGAESALYAWLLFGGVGARTRRGCGTLYTSEWPFSGDVSQLENYLRQLVEAPAGDSLLGLPVPTLRGARLLIGNARCPNAVAAWKAAVEAMQQFRQGPGIGRDEGSIRPAGESRWPEADSIRSATRKHAGYRAPFHPAQPYYPRADLGLPIVVHFLRDDHEAGDPEEVTIGPPTDSGKARMASPIILKALPTGENSAVPIALQLHAPHVWDTSVAPQIVLWDKESKSQVGAPLDPISELQGLSKRAQVPPLRDYRGGGAREAFMEYFKQQKRAQEVML